MSHNSSNCYINNLTIIQESWKPNMPSGLEVCKINIAGHSLDNFKTFDLTGYKVLCRLGETCETLNFFSITSKILLNIEEQSQLGYNL